MPKLNYRKYKKNFKSDINGFIPIWKPVGYSSNHIVQAVKAILLQDGKNKHLKIGHGGTLDPLACGVLVLGLGTFTKNLASFLDGTKEYYVEGEFGSWTDTFDCEGQVLGECPSGSSSVQEQDLVNVLSKFRGEIMQRAPVYSALRVNGQRMYDIARSASADEIEQLCAKVEARPVTIHDIRLLKFSREHDKTRFLLKIRCSSGTYMRSIIHDIGMQIKLNDGPVFAHMVSLVRTQQGPYTADQCSGLSKQYLTQFPYILKTIEQEKPPVVHEEIPVCKETVDLSDSNLLEMFLQTSNDFYKRYAESPVEVAVNTEEVDICV